MGTMARQATPYLSSHLDSQSLTIEQSNIAVYLFWCTSMPSDLQSALELQQMNDYVSRMVTHGFGMINLINLLKHSCYCHCCPV